MLGWQGSPRAPLPFMALWVPALWVSALWVSALWVSALWVSGGVGAWRVTWAEDGLPRPGLQPAFGAAGAAGFDGARAERGDRAAGAVNQPRVGQRERLRLPGRPWALSGAVPSV